MIRENVQNEYMPDFVSPPGETLQDVLAEIGMKQTELARRTGRPVKTINEIIQGKTAITPETALQLERVLGIPAGFWIRREQQYREHLVRQQEIDRLEKQVSWLKKIPVKAMVAKGWIKQYSDPVRQLQEVLNFFGIASVDQWDTVFKHHAPAFRQSKAYQANPVAVAAWIQKGKLEAQKIHCAPYNSEKFREALNNIRALTTSPPNKFCLEMQRLCAESGVAIVFVPQLPKTRVSGATYWLTPHKALIQLSLRYKTDDHFWFTFFHEAGHILLHGKRKFFLEENGDTGASDNDEREANQFAAAILIPPDDWQHLKQSIPTNKHISKKFIREWAARLGISTGILVGRLQHEGLLPFKYCNDLKVKLIWGNQ